MNKWQDTANMVVNLSLPSMQEVSWPYEKTLASQKGHCHME